MTKAKTSKNIGALRESTNLVPKTKSNTRWTASFAMIHRFDLDCLSFYTYRYFELEPAFEEIESLELFLLTRAEKKALKSIYEEIKDLHSITMVLQDSKLTMSQVRHLFYGVMRRFPTISLNLRKMLFLLCWYFGSVFSL